MTEPHLHEVHYGVVRQGDGWAIIGPGLKVGGYARRSSAVRAARRLALSSAGLPVLLHVQDEDGVLRPPRTIQPRR
jgi:hypothetical protein